MIRMLGALVEASRRAEELVANLEARLAEARVCADNLRKRPRVFFEEWDDPLIYGIAWASELVEIAGSIDIFADLRNQGAAKDRVVTTEEVVAWEPDRSSAPGAARSSGLSALRRGLVLRKPRLCSTKISTKSNRP
jgi:iron complex transport system substrate-binding protein